MSTTPTTTESLPGLKLRCRAAMVNVMRSYNPDAAEELLSDILDDAHLLGYRGYQAGVYTPPILIAGDASLLEGWNAGQETAATFLT